jgi:hypothetical protein
MHLSDHQLKKKNQSHKLHRLKFPSLGFRSLLLANKSLLFKFPPMKNQRLIYLVVLQLLNLQSKLTLLQKILSKLKRKRCKINLQMPLSQSKPRTINYNRSLKGSNWNK